MTNIVLTGKFSLIEDKVTRNGKPFLSGKLDLGTGTFGLRRFPVFIFWSCFDENAKQSILNIGLDNWCYVSGEIRHYELAPEKQTQYDKYAYTINVRGAEPMETQQTTPLPKGEVDYGDPISNYEDIDADL